MQVTTPKIRQTVWDVALEHTGSIETAMDIARMNDRSASEDIYGFGDITVPSPKNQRVINQFKSRKFSPTSI
jgi:hypothetical protein